MKRYAWLFLALLVTLLLAYIIVPPMMLRSQPVEQTVSRHIEHMTGASLEFESFEVSYFPFLSVDLKNARLVTGRSNTFDIRAKDFRVFLSRLPLLAGKTDIARVAVDGGELDLELPGLGMTDPLNVKDLKLELGSLKAGKTVQARLSGAVGGVADSMAANFSFVPYSLEGWEWKKLGFDAELSLTNLNLLDLKRVIKKWTHANVVQGTWGGNWVIRKDPAEVSIHMDSQLKVRNLVYRISGENQGITSPRMDMSLDYSLVWNPEAEVLTLEQSLLRLPVGQVRTNGAVLLKTGELQDLNIVASQVMLENIPQYFVALKEVIPFNIGFSGASNFEVALSGTQNDLSIHANWDLSRALLTYARYFSKPKDFPLRFSCEWQIKDMNLLSGDFSVSFKDMLAKGTLTDVNLEKGDGQMNLITNKFSLAGWEALMPPLQNYQLRGSMKLLANFKGDLQNLYNAQSMFNVTLDDGFIQGPSGYYIRDAFVTFDLSPLSLEIRKANLYVGESPLRSRFILYGVQDHPRFRLKLQSDKFEPSYVYRAFGDIFGGWVPEEAREAVFKTGFFIEEIAPPGEIFENFEFETSYEQGRWSIPVWNFDAYGGKARLSGRWKFLDVPPSYELDMHLERLSLARFGRRGGKEENIIEGNLFLKSRLYGRLAAGSEWQDQVRGEGEILITNGEFRTFDLLGEISRLSDFSALRGYVMGATPFHDFSAYLKLENRKVSTENITLLTNHVMARGAGEVSLDGVLNHRLNVYLNSALFNGRTDPGAGTQNEYAGPVSLLLSGPFVRPELKPDPALLPSLSGALFKKTAQPPFTHFLPEEFFLDKTERP